VPEIKIICWNVNGLRAVHKRGFLPWLQQASPDILCLQETKATPADLAAELRQPPGYYSYWNNPVRKGYAGVATYCRQRPEAILTDLLKPTLDTEGRALVTRHPGFTLYNIYFPNGKKDAFRLQYKLDFYEAVLADLETRRRQGEPLIICGDYNTAHKEIDLARPRENERVSGFLPVERAWLDKVVALGYIDIFRHLHPEPGQYTWWDMKTRARERGIGWRIDYFFITPDLLPAVKEVAILKEIIGSDHCPIQLILKTT